MDNAPPANSGRYLGPAIAAEAFGAVGDGAADDTDALQCALDATAETGTCVDLAARVYAVRTLTLTAGMGGLVGPGCLRALGAEEAVLRLEGELKGQGAVVRGLRISGLTIEVHGARHAIHARQVHDSVIENCLLTCLHNLSKGILLHHGCVNVTVRGNTIDADTHDIESLVCIGIESPMAEGISGYFHGAGGSVTYLPETTYDNLIDGNRISGGSHGVAIGGASRNRIVNNSITGSEHRNINICPASRYNLVANNNLFEAGSSAVAMAYGSSHNVVTGNNIMSTRTVADWDRDAIHAYVSSTHNVIVGNRILGDFRYGVYLAVNACHNTVHDNTIELTPKADLPDDFTVGIVVENEWPERPLPAAALYSRRNFGSAKPYRWAVGDSGWNSIRGNHLVSCTCGIYLSQLGPVFGNRGNVIAGTVMGRALAHGVYAYAEGSGLLTGNILEELHVHSCPGVPVVAPAGTFHTT